MYVWSWPACSRFQNSRAHLSLKQIPNKVLTHMPMCEALACTFAWAEFRKSGFQLCVIIKTISTTKGHGATSVDTQALFVGWLHLIKSGARISWFALLWIGLAGTRKSAESWCDHLQNKAVLDLYFYREFRGHITLECASTLWWGRWFELLKLCTLRYFGCLKQKWPVFNQSGCYVGPSGHAIIKPLFHQSSHGRSVTVLLAACTRLAYRSESVTRSCKFK